MSSRSAELREALDQLEDWWKSARSDNSSVSPTRTGRESSARFFLNKQQHAFAAHPISSIHPAVLEAERESGAARLGPLQHPIERLHTENQALRTELAKVLSQPPAASTPPPPPTSPFKADPEALAHATAAAQIAATTVDLARAKAVEVAAVRGEAKLHLAEAQRAAELEKAAAVEATRRECEEAASAALDAAVRVQLAIEGGRA
jgi:hypothetical protein